MEQKIENGLLNANWNELYFAFTTKDQNNTYFHSGRIENNKMYGLSYAPKRSLAAPWTGEKLK